MYNFDELLKKYGYGKEVDTEDKANFFDKMADFFSFEHLKVLWHIVTHTDCASKVFLTWEMAMLIAAVVYVISPIDAVPDFIPVAGLLDDAAVVAFIIDMYGDKIEEYKQLCM